MLTVLAICLVLCLAGCGGPSPPPRVAPRVEDGRPSFLMRVQENCQQGQRWACDMLNSLSNALREREGR